VHAFVAHVLAQPQKSDPVHRLDWQVSPEIAAQLSVLHVLLVEQLFFPTQLSLEVQLFVVWQVLVGLQLFVMEQVSEILQEFDVQLLDE
jgi:hypothetical protein